MTITPFRPGSVTSRNCCQGVAPSTAAASYSDAGIVCRPARIMIAKNGKPCQTSATMIAYSAVPGWASQGTASVTSPSRSSRSLNRPTCGWYIQAHISAITTDGSAQGIRIRLRARPRQRKRWFSSSAVASPSASCSGTVSPIHITVRPSDDQATGSCATAR